MPAARTDLFRPAVSIVIPNWNGLRWLPGCLASIAAQTLPPAEIVVVDNGSSDGSLAYLRREHRPVRVIELGHNTGFAHAANRGIEAARSDWVALINADVVLREDWVARLARAGGDPAVAAVACKMLSLERPSVLYDAGDVLRRDGVCEQRGRFTRDDGRFDQPGEVFGACGGAALLRRSAVLSLGGFDERYFAYLEDADLALRLRLAGWGCRYEPAVALHAGEASSGQLSGGHHPLVARNTLLLIAKAWPLRWLPLVAYRQLSAAWWALRERRLRSHLRGLAAAVPLLPAVLGERRALRRGAVVSIAEAIPARPWRGERAEGHRSQHAPEVVTASERRPQP